MDGLSQAWNVSNVRSTFSFPLSTMHDSNKACLNIQRPLSAPLQKGLDQRGNPIHCNLQTKVAMIKQYPGEVRLVKIRLDSCLPSAAGLNM